MTKERKYILAGGLILLLFGVIYRFAPDFSLFFSLDEETAVKIKKVVAYRKVVNQKSEYEKAYNRISRTLVQAESRLLRGRTPGLAAVDIQNIINDIADRSRVNIKTMRVLKTKKMDDENYMGVPVEFSISSTMRQLKEILYRIESSERMLSVEAMTSRVRGRSLPVTIETTMTVAGLMRNTPEADRSVSP